MYFYYYRCAMCIAIILRHLHKSFARTPVPYVEISLSIITNRDVVGRAGVHSKESFLATPKYICLFIV